MKTKKKESNNNNNNKKKEVEIMEIQGIPYYVDAQQNVYRHETIHLPNPEIIGCYKGSGEEKRFLRYT